MIQYVVKTEKQTNRFGKSFFYPIIEFYCKAFGFQQYYINSPKQTRSKARTIGKNYVKSL